MKWLNLLNPNPIIFLSAETPLRYAHSEGKSMYFNVSLKAKVIKRQHSHIFNLIWHWFDDLVTLLTLPASVYNLLITFANSFDTDQDRHFDT